ncbi:MAG: NAD-dependent epimerase/dehydratase family protein, partial [Planctomycetes bacterium]|nr:NAD-dependent epimerase/dehydratase family protein [Planctomycetota bacterium]
IEHDFHLGDACCNVTAEKACTGMDAVVHLAANPSVAVSLENPLECFRVNAQATLVMHEAAKRCGAKRFVFASSCALYGHSKPPLKEDTVLEPLSPYAAAKLASESFLRTAPKGGMSCVILRLFNVYGPRQNPKGPYAAVIPAFKEAIKNGQSPVIYGDGKQTRDFVHVDDVTRAILNAIELDASKVDASPINIGTGVETSLLDLLRILNVAMGREVKPTFAPARDGDVRHSCADIGRAKSVLNWQPQAALDSGLHK